MPTQGSRDLFGYEVVEGRQVVAAFDGGEVTSDAGAPLLGAAIERSGWCGAWQGASPTAGRRSWCPSRR
jgi:hypothetical protein